MNKITIAGRLGRDPETRVTPSGQKLTQLTVATSVYQGKDKEETIWWRVTFWGDDQKNKLPHLKKGSSVIIVGEFRKKPEIFTNKEGVQQISLEITGIYIDFNPFGRGDSQDQQQQQQRPAGAQMQPPHQHQSHHSNNENSFGEPEFLSSATGSFGGVPQYTSGMGSGHGSSGEDNMPF